MAVTSIITWLCYNYGTTYIAIIPNKIRIWSLSYQSSTLHIGTNFGWANDLWHERRNEWNVDLICKRAAKRIGNSQGIGSGSIDIIGFQVR